MPQIPGGGGGDSAALPFGISVDVSGIQDVANAVNAIAGALAAAYADFGTQTALPSGFQLTVLGPPGVIGTMDPAGEAPAPDVPDAWSQFCTAWGDYMDAAGATVSALSTKLTQTRQAYDAADGAAAKITAGANVLDPYTPTRSNQRLANLTTLAPPTGASTPQTASSRWTSLTTPGPPPPPPPPPAGSGTVPGQ